jgi:phosphate transport system protein
MKIHLQRETDHLKKRLYHLSSLVEENFKLAMQAVLEGDAELAKRVCDQDDEIDQLEVAVEEECLKILALYQPVATDLRLLVAALKINNELESIGDLAVYIARGKGCLKGVSLPDVLAGRFNSMGENARRMLRNSLESQMNMDAAKAREVLAADDVVDAEYHALSQLLSKELSAHPDRHESLVCWLLTAKSIERMADLATNIAEDTIYAVEGVIVRHTTVTG